jgi:hypothetical protein
MAICRARRYWNGGSMHWQEIEGWLQWRSAQEEATDRFPEASCFVEVGTCSCRCAFRTTRRSATATGSGA